MLTFPGKSITFDHSKTLFSPKDNSQDAFCPQLPFPLSEMDQKEWYLWWLVFVCFLRVHFCRGL